MNEQIAQALTKLFDRHRIIFWYDAGKELREDYESLHLAGVEKIELTNNEFGVKHRILREEPEQKFLLYREGPQPEDLDNWLLDVQLAHGEFRTDQVAIWLSELELGLEFSDVVKAHLEFYQAGKRRDALRRLLKSDDTPGMIRLKMLAVCTGSEPRLDSVMENLLVELAEGRDEKIKLISRCSLDGFLWEQMKRIYGYESEMPGVRDFVIHLFKDCYARNFDDVVEEEKLNQKSAIKNQKSRMSSDALVFLKRWKDSRRFEKSFEILSGECADSLGLEQDLSRRELRELVDLDLFRLIDQKIISELVRGVSSRTLSIQDVTLWVRQRRQGYWY